MNITFLVPPVLDGNTPAERSAGCTRVVYNFPNIYELTVVALIEREGRHNVAYQDFVYDRQSKTDFESWLRNDHSDIYFIWTVNLSIDSDLMALQLIRDTHPDAFVIFLGPGPTYFISKCLKSEKEIIVRGEPEMTVLELVRALSDGTDWHNILGISYLADGKVTNNGFRPLMDDIDSLPFPARHFIAHRHYHNPKLKLAPYTTALTSRNCPYKCIYCVPSSLTFAREIEYERQHGRKPTIAFRSPESVDAEMKELHSLGYKAIGFVDDNFIWNEKRTAALCEIMKKYGFVWGCQARVDAITEPIAKMLSESGCLYVDLGVESFDDDILKFIKKGITSDQIYTAINLLKKYGVPVKLNVLIGSSPLETKETIRHTLREAKRLDVDQVMFNIVSPFPGTEFYRLCKENGWLSVPDYVPTDVQRESILKYPHLSSKEMEQMLFRNNLSFFLSPKFVIKQLKRFRSWEEFKHAAKALKIKLFG